MLYQVAKSLHLIGMVSWMAGVFYLVRIMVNHAEALKLTGPERAILAAQYVKMEWKAYRIIIVPAIFITWSFGCTMLSMQPLWLSEGWMHAKLFFLVLFTGYTHYCKKHIKLLEAEQSPFTHVHYRAMNEVPTIILVSVVFLAVFKNLINWWYLGIGVLGFTALIGYAIYKVQKRGGL
jgi:protoporphyrinogen IX oxidase